MPNSPVFIFLCWAPAKSNDFLHFEMRYPVKQTTISRADKKTGTFLENKELSKSNLAKMSALLLF